MPTTIQFACSVLTALLLLLPDTCDGDDKAAKTTYKLPKDAKAVVIKLDWTGGRIRRKNPSPALTILADGKVVMPDRYGRSKDVVGKISPAELQELLRHIVADKKFFELDPRKIQMEIRKASGGRLIRILDNATTTIEVKLADKSHTTKFYAVSFFARRYKTVTSLQRLHAIEERLSRLMNITRLGGQKELSKMVVLANAQLKKRFPKAAPLNAANLRSVNIRSDDSKSVSFYRQGRSGNGQPDGSYTTATIKIPPNAKPKVTVFAKSK